MLSSSKEGKRCIIYTRVSSVKQIEGYSLEYQEELIRKKAEAEGMVVVDLYSDEGKSGATIKGRPAFTEMLEKIEDSATLEGVNAYCDYVCVFKLSRFGRSAADSLHSLTKLKAAGVHLYSIDEGIDSNSSFSSVFIALLSSMAELERENIITQTYAGKASSVVNYGRWPGGFAPYGYYLKDKLLYIAEDEADSVRLIFDLYTSQNAGFRTISQYLIDRGIKKKVRKNGKKDYFDERFIKSIIDNPVYAGFITLGRRKAEKVSPTSAETKIVRQKDFELYQGIHEPLISLEVWELAQEKRKKDQETYKHTSGAMVTHLLSGILRCPKCGGPMYCTGSAKKKKNGEGNYKPFNYYYCRHRLSLPEGEKCDFTSDLREDKMNSAVAEVLCKLVDNETLASALNDTLQKEVDISELEKEKESLKASLVQYEGAKRSLEREIDTLDVTSSTYASMYKDFSRRLYRLYDSIERVELDLSTVEGRISSIISESNAVSRGKEILRNFSKIWEKCEPSEQRKLIELLISKVEIFEKPLENGQILKSVHLQFPLACGGVVSDIINFDLGSHDETCVLMTKLKVELSSCEKIPVKIDLKDIDLTSAEAKATYGKIKKFVFEKYGVKVSSLNIAQVKADCGITERDCYNKASGKYRQPKCPQVKKDYIVEAFKYFKMI